MPTNSGASSNSPFVSCDDTILVLIDMQERLVPAMDQNERIVANARRLVALASTMGLPIVVTEQGKLGATLPELSESIPGFAPISKMTFNCFGTEEFVRRIESFGRTTLIIAGIEAHICVHQTALWAQKSYTVQVVADAISSRVPDNVAVTVDRMRTNGIAVTSTEMTIYELLEKAGTDQFKTMLPYIK
jgi:nicotinamidase-related amidase